MKINTIILILVIFLSTINLAHAQTFQTSAENSTINACQCELVNAPIFVQNTGNQVQAYTITNNLNDAQQSLILNPNEISQVPINIQTQCTKSTNTQLEVYIENNFQNKQVLTRLLNTNQCDNINATANYDQNIDPCGNQTYKIELINEASFVDTFQIKPIQNVNDFDYETQQVTLYPNQTGIFNYQSQKQCEIYGNITQQFQINSEKTQNQKIINASYEIDQNYDVELQIDSENYYCNEEFNQIPITITNEGAIDNTIDLIIERRQRQVTLENNTLEIAQGESKTINLNIRERDADLADITLVANTRIGDFQTKEVIQTDITSCYDSFNAQYVTSNRLCEDQTLIYKLDNPGPKELSLSANVTSKENSFESNITVPARSTYDFKLPALDLKTSNATNQYQTLTLNLKNEMINILNEQDIIVYSFDHCALPVITENAEDRYYAKNMTFAIENQGVKTNTYNITQLSNEDNFTLLSSEITLEPGQRKDLILQNNKGKELIGTHNINVLLQENGTDITHRRTVKITVQRDPVYIRIINSIRDFLFRPLI